LCGPPAMNPVRHNDKQIKIAVRPPAPGPPSRKG
jgi:hypothetical protein